MHRALSRRAYLLTRQLHTSAGRAATTALRTGAKAAAAPVVVRKGSLFDPEPAPAPPPEVILAEEAEPGLSAEEVEEVQARKDVEDKLVKTLGQKTVQNLLTMIPADLVKHLSEMCIYAGIDQLADYCKQNIFGYLREEPKSTANGLFIISDLILPTTGVSLSVRHRLRMAGRVEIDKLYVAASGKRSPIDVLTLETPMEEDATEERISRLDLEYYALRLEHGDYKANLGLAFLEESEIRRKLAEGKVVDATLDESRQRMLDQLSQAVEHNFSTAAFKLGKLYEEGHVIPHDSAKMVQWYERAISLGKLQAAVRLGELFQRLPKWLHRQQALVKPDRRRSLRYFEMAAEQWASAAVAAGFSYFRQPGASYREHFKTYETHPDDEKAAHFFGLAVDRQSWLACRLLADMLILDRADVPEEKRDDTARHQPKRIRQLEYAVQLLGTIPTHTDRKTAVFIKGLAESEAVARDLLAKARRGEDAMDFDELQVASWNPWMPAASSFNPQGPVRQRRGKKRIVNPEEKRAYEKRTVNPEEERVDEETMRKNMLANLLSTVKLRQAQQEAGIQNGRRLK